MYVYAKTPQKQFDRDVACKFQENNYTYMCIYTQNMHVWMSVYVCVLCMG